MDKLCTELKLYILQQLNDTKSLYNFILTNKNNYQLFKYNQDYIMKDWYKKALITIKDKQNWYHWCHDYHFKFFKLKRIIPKHYMPIIVNIDTKYLKIDDKYYYNDNIKIEIICYNVNPDIENCYSPFMEKITIFCKIKNNVYSGLWYKIRTDKDLKNIFSLDIFNYENGIRSDINLRFYNSNLVVYDFNFGHIQSWCIYDINPISNYTIQDFSKLYPHTDFPSLKYSYLKNLYLPNISNNFLIEFIKT